MSPPAREATTAVAIPVVDLGPYLAGEPRAANRAADTLRHALEEVGFYFVVNHPVPPRLVADVFEQARRFHALPLDAKLALRLNKHNIGYLPVASSVSRASTIDQVKKPNVVAALFLKRDRPPAHPDVLADVLFRGLNQWPADLPGFRERCLEYFHAMEGFCHRLLPLYARALELPADWFDQPFREAQITLRLSHYPPIAREPEQYGISGHTDSGFMTLLPDNDVEGLEIRPAGREWTPAPSIPGSFLVNSGDILKRWTNDRFLSTEHRVRNPETRDRYAVPYFFDPETHWPIECLPTCQSAENPPRYAVTTYERYLAWFTNGNYRGDAAARP
jgi:isopenicillin N synthase-like dioxygenase